MTLNYSFDHFSDPVHGEWYGYLNREGMRTHQLKGGPYKGCFHVPRGLLLHYTMPRRNRLRRLGHGCLFSRF